jgi:hypothetical protein
MTNVAEDGCPTTFVTYRKWRERLFVRVNRKYRADTQMPLNYGLMGAQPALFCPLDCRT